MTRYPGRGRASEIVLRGSGARYLVVAVLIAAMAAAVPAYLASTGVTLPLAGLLRVWAAVLVLVIGIGFVSGYYYSRRLALGGGRHREAVERGRDYLSDPDRLVGPCDALGSEGCRHGWQLALLRCPVVAPDGGRN